MADFVVVLLVNRVGLGGDGADDDLVAIAVLDRTVRVRVFRGASDMERLRDLM